MTSIYPTWSPSSPTPPEPTPLRKKAHYSWVISPPVQTPIRQIVYVGGKASDELYQAFDSDCEVMVLRTSFRAHYWLEQLIEESSSQLPEAILCDLDLPDGSMFELFDRIRRMPHLKNIPFFAISASEDKAASLEVLRHGLDDLFTIPFNRKDIETRTRFLNEYQDQLREPLPDKQERFEFTPSEAKRMLDVWVAFLGLTLLSPLLVLISILIKLSSRGPVFQINKYAGIGYQVFSCYKFRTHKIDKDGDGLTQEMTGVGKWLSRYNLNELPQLINILIGDMSLVGNRPLPLMEAEQLTTDQWAKRFLAPAGITGLWQIARRTNKHLSEKDRRKMDIDYADHASFRNDIHILIKTIVILLRRSTE